MGEGLEMKCSICNKKYDIWWGCGFSFQSCYEELMKEIKEGKYGLEWKNLVNKEKYAAIDAGDYVYQCEKCGYWTVEPDLSVYVPADPEDLKVKYHLDSVDELSEREYVMAYSLEEEYKLIKKHVHICAKCDNAMRKLSYEEIKHVKCPYCGGNSVDDETSIICWD